MFNFCLVTVRFRPGAQVYTYKTDEGVKVGDKVSVYSWVSQSKVILTVEDVLPFNKKESYTYAAKVQNV